MNNSQAGCLHGSSSNCQLMTLHTWSAHSWLCVQFCAAFRNKQAAYAAAETVRCMWVHIKKCEQGWLLCQDSIALAHADLQQSGMYDYHQHTQATSAMVLMLHMQDCCCSSGASLLAFIKKSNSSKKPLNISTVQENYCMRRTTCHSMTWHNMVWHAGCDIMQ